MENMQNQHRKEQFAGRASSFCGFLSIHPLAVLPLHPFMCKLIQRKWGRMKVCVHMCIGLEVTASR